MGASGKPPFPHCSHNGIPTKILQNHEKVDFQISEIQKYANSLLLRSAQVKPIPGIKRYDMRLSSPKRVWDEKNSSFFCRDFRKITFFRLQSQRNFHQNPENHEKVHFLRFLKFKSVQNYDCWAFRRSNQHQGSKGMI